MLSASPGAELAHPAALAPATTAWLPALAGRSWAGDVYLAGSAALALHLGHRPVRDLDLMSLTNRLAPPDRRDLLADLLALAPGCEVETARDGYLFARLPDGVALRFFHYPYPLIDPQLELDGLAVASLADLGLMKLAAVVSRAARRDLVDLYLLCRELPLAALLGRADEKFGHVRDFPLQALKALAEAPALAAEPLPALAVAVEWSAVVAWARGEVRALGRAHCGLG
jgi:hypothetical protein